jgi:hypothetical protein
MGVKRVKMRERRGEGAKKVESTEDKVAYLKIS